MTTTTDDYIARVLQFLPPNTPARDQIATELRGHIAERLASGQPAGQVLQQLGDPLALAESYLSAVPLRSASFGRRVVAKLIDLALILVWFVPIMCMAFFASSDRVQAVPAVHRDRWLEPAGGDVSRARRGAQWADAGQAADGTACGARIRRPHQRRTGDSATAADVPADWHRIDVLFALFTEKHQRAFELLSKTRVVEAERANGGSHVAANTPRTVAL